MQTLPYSGALDRNGELTALVLRERARLARFIRRRVSDPRDAEDILHDVLFALVEAFRAPATIEHAGGWLFRVARNRIVDFFRRKKEVQIGPSGGFDEVDASDDPGCLDSMLPAADGGPEADYVRSAFFEELLRALEMLPREQREVFVGHELENKSFKELSRETGVGISTLLARKHYAVKSLRARLRTTFDELDI